MFKFVLWAYWLCWYFKFATDILKLDVNIEPDPNALFQNKAHTM